MKKFKLIKLFATVFVGLLMLSAAIPGAYAADVASGNASLSGINVIDSTLSPAFSPDVLNYTVTPAPSGMSASVYVSLADPAASVSINGENKSSVKLSLNDPAYSATANIEVTAADGMTKKIYTVTITESNAELSSISVNWIYGGSLTPSFKPEITPYTVKLAPIISFIELYLTPADWRSSIKVNGNPLWMHDSIYSCGVGNVGNYPTSLAIEVTAVDGVAKKIYNIVLSDEDTPQLPPTGTVVNCTTSVNVRSGPGTSFAVIGSAPKGTVYAVTGQSGSWYKIVYGSKTGYISSGYFSVSSTPPVETPPSDQTGTVVNCTSGVNVRSGPGTNYSIIGSAPKGAKYTVTAQSGSWYKIVYGSKTGYISSGYFSVSSTPPVETPPSASQTGTVVNCTSGVNVRSGPGTNYSIIGSAPKGAKYTVTGQSGSWYKIVYGSKTGYISSSYFSVSSTPPVETPPSASQTGTVVNCTSGVNVRSGPGTNYSIIGSAPKGAKYTVTGQSGSWYKIDYNGKAGYISGSYLSVK